MPGCLLDTNAHVSSRSILGKHTHDARLVAAMLASGIGRLLTFNVGDFPADAGIEVTHPAQVS